MRASEFAEDMFGVAKRRAARKGQRPVRGHEPVQRYHNVKDNSDEEQLDELSFLGSPCTKDCSGHRAGYAWSARHGDVDSASWSDSFNRGAHLRATGN